MKLLDLKLQAFGPFLKEQHIPFNELNDKGMFLINGTTGCGKTTIFDAIVYALYGKASGNDRSDIKSLRSDFAKEDFPTYVDLTFEANGKVYRVVRKMAYMRKAKRGDGYTEEKPVSELHMPDGKVIEKNIDSIIENEILFINRDQFKNIALLAQGEFTDLIVAKSNERADILEHIFQKEIYKEFQEKLINIAKKKEAELSNIKSSINTLISSVADGELIPGYDDALGDPANNPDFIKNIDRTLDDLNIELETAKQEDEEARKAYVEAKSKLDSLVKNNEIIGKYLAALEKKNNLDQQDTNVKATQEIYDRYSEFKQTEPFISNAKNYEKQIESFEEKLNNAKEKQEELKKEKEFLEAHSDEYKGNIDKLAKESVVFENLKNLNKQKKTVVDESNAFKLKDFAFNEEYKDFEKLENEFKQTRDLFYASTSYNLAKELEEGKPCPVCGSTHHPKLAVATNVVSESQFKSIEEKYNRRKDQIESLRLDLNSKKSALETIENQMVQVLKDNGFSKASKELIYSNEITNLLNNTEVSIKNLKSNISNYESRNDAFKNDETKNKQDLKNFGDNLNTAKEDFDKAKFALQEKIDGNKLFKDTSVIPSIKGLKEEEIKNAWNDHVNKKISLQTIIDNTPNELKVNKQFDESKLVEDANLKDSISKAAATKKNEINNKIESLEKSKKVIKDKYTECKETIEEYSSLNELSRTANGNNRMHLSFKMYILADYFDKIIAKANTRLSKISNGRYKLVRRDAEGKGSGLQGLDLDVYDVETGKNRAAATLSGGEKFVSALSMALGLSDIIETNHALIQVESIFIDEGFGTLDENYIETAMKALETLKDDNKTVAIISHVEKLKEYISSGLEVVKDNVGSTIKVKDNV